MALLENYRLDHYIGAFHHERRTLREFNVVDDRPCNFSSLKIINNDTKNETILAINLHICFIFANGLAY